MNTSGTDDGLVFAAAAKDWNSLVDINRLLVAFQAAKKASDDAQAGALGKLQVANDVATQLGTPIAELKLLISMREESARTALQTSVGPLKLVAVGAADGELWFKDLPNNVQFETIAGFLGGFLSFPDVEIIQQKRWVVSKAFAELKATMVTASVDPQPEEFKDVDALLSLAATGKAEACIVRHEIGGGSIESKRKGIVAEIRDLRKAFDAAEATVLHATILKQAKLALTRKA